ncbi:beta-N-acetylhexosaminidase [Tistlia consotensis]|uniref:beta-N-acetylhexosaminidase n=1 Tax=Tistlia consotensis USBA 355 TaxID=560819 RepID=A0A1Y6BK65_9PROT|nr:beta-N-acetylhexosaminidase [Tistlia consotensis]SMF14203.1 beta-N-acetylhexosaminidase [Tistlia consotensis USBA 355]SNR49704.1 beta-N-acetylhexosaminidase [Tistlia consotensis]
MASASGTGGARPGWHGARTTAAIVGCAGLRLDEAERRLFRETDPLGFILFARNVESPAQVAALVEALRDSVGRRAPVLIDQEGGRVQRLRPPHWRQAPAAEAFARLYETDPERACALLRLNLRLIAAELAELGIDVDCVPCLDLRLPEGHGVIGDRAYGSDPAQVAALGRAACEGLLAGGVLPVIKHLPGHGRATADSHHELPRVATPLETLRATDLAPFRALADQPLGMTAHIVFEAVDGERPVTTSPAALERLIRREIGFDGLLMSDDLFMEALQGGLAERAAASVAAGCDCVLICHGSVEERRAAIEASGPLSAEARIRAERAAACLAAPQPFDRAAALVALEGLAG